MSDYKELLGLLQKHTELFQELADIQQNKMEATQQYDIVKLEECMKKEQADTLALRGYDKKRLLLQKQLSYENLTLQQIIPLLPEEYRADYSQSFQQLNQAYSLYRSTADCAKQLIEVNIHRLGIAIHDLKKKTNTISGDVYTQDGSVNPESLTFRDMKI